MSDESRPLLDLHHLGHRQTGNETWARALSAALFELEGTGAYDIAVTSEAPDEDLAQLPARERVLVGSNGARRLAWDLPGALRRLRSTAVLVQYTAPLTRVPAVVAVHDLSFEHPKAREWLPPATLLRYRATIRPSVRRAAHVLALSESTRSDLIERYRVDPALVTVVHAAVDPRMAARLAAAPERRHGPPTVLAVGNVLPRKNLVVVARAVRLLRDRGLDSRFKVVGLVPPSGAAQAREMAALLGDSLEMTGHVDSERLVAAYRSAHVLAFPSLFEGFGIPALEALAAGLPVVVSDRTSLPEVVADVGIVLPAEDVEAWADALEERLRAGVDPVLAQRGRAWQSTFSWAAAAERVRFVFQQSALPSRTL